MRILWLPGSALTGVVEEGTPEDQRKTVLYRDTIDGKVVDTDDPRLPPPQYALSNFDQERDALTLKLVETQPRSVAGAAALLRDAAEVVTMGDSERPANSMKRPDKNWFAFLHRTLAGALDDIMESEARVQSAKSIEPASTLTDRKG